MKCENCGGWDFNEFFECEFFYPPNCKVILCKNCIESELRDKIKIIRKIKNQIIELENINDKNVDIILRDIKRMGIDI